jgi:hypothetical protein
MRAGHLRGLAREALEALVLERAETDEDFALWLDARLAARQPRGAESCAMLKRYTERVRVARRSGRLKMEKA